MATWWSGGPDDVATHQPGLWALMTSGMKACLQVTDPPLSPLGMLGTCAALAAIPIYGTALQVGLYTYADYYCAAYAANPPATETDTPVVYSIPADYDPISALDNDIWQYVKVQNSRMYGFLGDWTTFLAQWQWFYTHAEYNHDDVPLPAATSTDTSRLLAAVFAVANAVAKVPTEKDTNRILAAMFAVAHQVGVGPVLDMTDLTTRLDAIDTDLDGLASGQTDILDAIAGIDGGSSGPPVWPGLASVTLGAPQALDDQTVITAPMDGVLVNITTLPTKVGKYLIGGAYYDYKVGEVAFETDNGDLEPWQYLGFRQAIYTPKTMRQAAKVRFRVLAGASGTCRIWTVT